MKVPVVGASSGRCGVEVAVQRYGEYLRSVGPEELNQRAVSKAKEL